jgi:hypothetical protein
MVLALRYLGAGEFQAVHPALADKQLVIGEVRRWDIIVERSAASHAHYFAAVNDAWLNLPSHLSIEFPSSEHLRKWALIKSGYCIIDKVVCASAKEAIRSMVTIRRLSDDYVIFERAGRVLTIYRAKSQSLKAMGTKKEFQESKDKVLDVLSELIGTDAGTLKRQAA